MFVSIQGKVYTRGMLGTNSPIERSFVKFNMSCLTQQKKNLPGQLIISEKNSF